MLTNGEAQQAMQGNTVLLYASTAMISSVLTTAAQAGSRCHAVSQCVKTDAECMQAYNSSQLCQLGKVLLLLQHGSDTGQLYSSQLCLLAKVLLLLQPGSQQKPASQHSLAADFSRHPARTCSYMLEASSADLVLSVLCKAHQMSFALVQFDVSAAASVR